MSKQNTDTDGPTIDDPDDYVTTRRLQDIFDARGEVRAGRTEIVDFKAELSTVRLMTFYRGRVAGYVQEVYPLFTANDSGLHLWNQRDFGTARAEIYHEYPGNTSVTHEDAKTYEVRGLKSLFELDSPIVAKFEVPQGGGIHTRETQLSQQQLDEMVFAVDGFLNEIGVEVDLGAAEEWEI